MIRKYFVSPQWSLAGLQAINKVKSLSLRGNNFVSGTNVGGLFKNYNFENLQVLDIGDSKFPRNRGAFAGLPELRTLRAGSNNFADLTQVNLWEGSLSTKLEILELEMNKMIAMPNLQFFSAFSNSIKTLDLSENNLYDLQFGSAFPNVKTLNLRNTGLADFSSTSLKQFTKLESLDLSCNRFSVVKKEFFTDLPNTVNFLNLTFCPAVQNSDADAVIINDDAFTTFKQIASLSMNNGFLRDDIFAKLNRMPVESKNALKYLSLNANGIRYFNLTSLTFSGFNLTYLSLMNNQIQTISFAEFTDPSWKDLITLDLSDNLLTILRESNFKGNADFFPIFIKQIC